MKGQDGLSWGERDAVKQDKNRKLRGWDDLERRRRGRERNRKERKTEETSVANLLLLGFLLTEKNLTLSSSSSQGSIVIGLGSTRLDTVRLLLGT